MSITGLGVVTKVLLELGVIQASETPGAADQQFVLEQVNRVLDNWNAERGAIYAESFETFTLAANLSPHTIGPAPAQWLASSRPESVDAASVVLTDASPFLNLPIRLRDAQWWALQDPTLTASTPTDLYYDPTWPSGSLYFYPTPVAYSSPPPVMLEVQLRMRIVLAALALTDTVSLPPGYLDALIGTAAEASAPGFFLPVSPALSAKATAARQRIGADNDRPIRSLFGPRTPPAAPEAA